MLSEYKYHFEVGEKDKIQNIFYFHLENETNTQQLRREFDKEENKNIDIKFSKRIPDNLTDEIPRCSIIVFDDMENQFANDKNLQNQLFHFSSVLCHHKKIFLIFVAQSVGILKKNHKLCSCISQATHFVLFRNIVESKSLIRFLGSLSIKMKSGLSLSDTYEKYILPHRYAYICLNVSPRSEKSTAFSNILLCDSGSMLSFHEDEEEDDL